MTVDDDPSSFDHDETTFERASVVGNLVLVRGELEYADLYTEVIWDGLITAEKRERLDRAAEVFGLAPARAGTIEQALRASFEAQHRIPVREEGVGARPVDDRLQTSHDFPPQLAAGLGAPMRTRTGTDIYAPVPGVGEPGARSPVPSPRELGTVAPLDDTDDLLLSAMNRRLAALAAERDAANAERDRLAQRIHDLESELDLAHRASDASIDVELSFASGGSVRGEDPEVLHRRLAHTPLDLELVVGLFHSLKRAQDVDRRTATAGVAVALAARLREDAPGEVRAAWQARPGEALIRPARALDAEAWRMLADGEDEDARAVLAEVTPAAVIVRMASRHRAELDASTRVEPHGSTIQAVRCVAWASAILGLEVPPIHTDASRKGLVDLVLAPPLATVLKRDALSGASAADLAFLAGRHLAFHRPEHVLVGLSAPTKDLEDVFLAGLLLGNASLPLAPDVRARAEPLARALQPLLDGGAASRLRDAFSGFVERGGRTHLGRWATAVHVTAARAGLLLCANPQVAASMIERIDAARHDDLLHDLVIFGTSAVYAEIRKRIGISF